MYYFNLSWPLAYLNPGLLLPPSFPMPTVFILIDILNGWAVHLLSGLQLNPFAFQSVLMDLLAWVQLSKKLLYTRTHVHTHPTTLPLPQESGLACQWREITLRMFSLSVLSQCVISTTIEKLQGALAILEISVAGCKYYGSLSCVFWE